MKKIFSYILYIMSFIPLLIYAYIAIAGIYNVSELFKILLIVISSVFMYFAGLLLSLYKKDNKPMKHNMYIFFIIYLIIVINLTLFDTSWGRSGIRIKSLSHIKNIIKYINLTPFKTIKLYIRVFDSLYPTKEIILNLFGNFVAFMPMSIFLPLLFKKQNKWYIFLITMILMITSIEFMQLITGSGRCDIDDLILNVGGAFLLFIIIKIPQVNRIIRNVFLLEKNRISKITIVIIILVLLSTVGFFTYLVNYRNKLFNKRIDELYAKYSFNVEIEDTTRYCEDEEEMFFEDDLYKYFFECKKSDNIYVIVNSDERYKLKEVLEDDFKYNINIELLERLGLVFTKENKYKYIDITTKCSKSDDDAYIKPVVHFETDDEYLAVMTSEPVISSSNYKFKLHFIPKAEGETTLKIIVKDSKDEEIIEEFEYSITIDENLNLKYKELDEN